MTTELKWRGVQTRTQTKEKKIDYITIKFVLSSKYIYLFISAKFRILNNL